MSRNTLTMPTVDGRLPRRGLAVGIHRKTWSSARRRSHGISVTVTDREGEGKRSSTPTWSQYDGHIAGGRTQWLPLKPWRIGPIRRVAFLGYSLPGTMGTRASPRQGENWRRLRAMTSPLFGFQRQRPQATFPTSSRLGWSRMAGQRLRVGGEEGRGMLICKSGAKLRMAQQMPCRLRACQRARDSCARTDLSCDGWGMAMRRGNRGGQQG
ncbi:hypothetical protein GGS23DRAFT_581138, partial [Durotheca rogersii]|uniref:uncharacterized protein n=1 Tax=Durotheca rogersii TaxID=419775 RepID=UPI0022205447